MNADRPDSPLRVGCAPREAAAAAARDNRPLATGVLTITACLLVLGHLLLPSGAQPVLATGQLDRGGDYIMLTQQVSNSQEGIVVIDAAAKRLNMYLADANTGRLDLLQSNISLDRGAPRRDGPGGRR
jgi:hypothetical protein